MSKKAFDKIAAGLEAAIDYAEGRAQIADYVVHLPSVDVAALRHRLGLSQSLFAARFGFAPADVLAWEAGERPEGAVRAYLRVIERDPNAVLRALDGPSEQTAA